MTISKEVAVAQAKYSKEAIKALKKALESCEKLWLTVDGSETALLADFEPEDIEKLIKDAERQRELII